MLESTTAYKTDYFGQVSKVNPFDDLLVREYFHYLEVMTMKFGVHIYL